MRRSPGRDLGLSVRMAIALGLVGLLYVAAEAALVTAAVSAFREGEVLASLGAIMFAVAIPLAVFQLIRGADSLVLRAVRAKVLQPAEEPELHGLVQRLAAQADIPAPRIALARSSAPNALAAGTPAHGAVVVLTSELLRRLDGSELEAVVAHEIAHIANGDGHVMTFVSGPAMAGPALLRQNDDPRRYVAYALYFPIYVVGLLLMWTFSRYREFVADRTGALLTGSPQHLISALLELEGGKPPQADLRGGLAVQAFCIVPRRRRRLWIFSGHPPVRRRVARLERLARELGQPA